MPSPTLTLLTLALLLPPTLLSSASNQTLSPPQSVLPFTDLHQSNTCSCTCSLDDPKVNPPCAAAPPNCQISRCSPRVDGFACCDGLSTPISVSTPADVAVELETIEENVEAAVSAEPELVQAQVDILTSCIDDLLALTADDDATVVSRQMGRRPLTPAQIARGRMLFRIVRDESTQVLRQVLNQLRDRIRDRLRPNRLSR